MSTINIINFIDIVTDSRHRDLTINSIISMGDGTIIDPFNGQDDIDNKILRHVSLAFADDPVRVLRLARFNARFGAEWTVALETKELIARMIDAGTLEELTVERVWKELYSALKLDNSYIFFETLFDVGAMAIIFPELNTLGIDKVCEVLDGCISPKEKMASLYNALCEIDVTLAEKFIDMRISYNISNFIKSQVHFRNIYKLAEAEYASTKIDSIINAMSKIEEDMLVEILNFIGIHAFKADMLTCFYICRDVGYEYISPEVRPLLKGQEIGVYLRKTKNEIIFRLLF